MEQFKEKLKRAGLTGNEAKVYLELLRRGEINGSSLSKKVSLDRSLTYTILNNLIDKGLVSYVIKDKKRLFRAADPENLLFNIQQKEREIKSFIPELKTIERLSGIPQSATVYEGKDGLRVLAEEALKSNELLFFGGTARSYEVLKWEMPHFEKKMIKKNKKVRGIMNSKYKENPMNKLKNVKLKFIEGIDSDATTTIFRDGIGIHTLRDKPFIIIIKNKTIAEGYRNYFEYMWKK